MTGFYVYVLEGSRNLLSDERNKMHLLQLFFAMLKRQNWMVYSFCVTDDSAYSIVKAPDEEALCQELGGVAADFLKYRMVNPWPDAQCYLTVRRLQSCQAGAVLGQIRRMHRLPLELGYVKRLRDYWWSSYITYAGIYYWPCMSCQLLLGQFSGNRLAVKRQLQKFHLNEAELEAEEKPVKNNEEKIKI